MQHDMSSMITLLEPQDVSLRCWKTSTASHLKSGEDVTWCLCYIEHSAAWWTSPHATEKSLRAGDGQTKGQHIYSSRRELLMRCMLILSFQEW